VRRARGTPRRAAGGARRRRPFPAAPRRPVQRRTGRVRRTNIDVL